LWFKSINFKSTGRRDLNIKYANFDQLKCWECNAYQYNSMNARDAITNAKTMNIHWLGNWLIGNTGEERLLGKDEQYEKEILSIIVTAVNMNIRKEILSITVTAVKIPLIDFYSTESYLEKWWKIFGSFQKLENLFGIQCPLWISEFILLFYVVALSSFSLEKSFPKKIKYVKLQKIFS